MLLNFYFPDFGRDILLEQKVCGDTKRKACRQAADSRPVRDIVYPGISAVDIIIMVMSDSTSRVSIYQCKACCINNTSLISQLISDFAYFVDSSLSGYSEYPVSHVGVARHYHSKLIIINIKILLSLK